mgnify:CR=1 FL=1
MHAFIYNKENLHPGYLIVEVHGGGFMYNTAADDDDFCHFIHQTLGIPVIACDYSLTPEHPFPIGLEDVYDCVLHALSMKELKARPDRIILWGHSAGANLAAGTVYMARENQQFTPCMQILDYPYMDPYRSSAERRPIRNSVSGKLMDTFCSLLYKITGRASECTDLTDSLSCRNLYRYAANLYSFCVVVTI